MLYRLSTVAALCLLLTACESKKQATTETSDAENVPAIPATSTDNQIVKSQSVVADSLAYRGTYRGVIPCADCNGIRMEVELKVDNTYRLVQTYVGKGDEKPVEKTGTYAWTRADSLVTLSGITDQPNQFLASKGTLTQLDMDGTKPIGKMAKRYILSRQ